MNNRYRLTITFLLATLLAGMDAWAGVTIHGSVYGGGNLANVGDRVEVNIKGGTIEQNVYGGGAFANTNTGNLESEQSEQLIDIDERFCEVYVAPGSSLDGYYTLVGDDYTPASGTAGENEASYYKERNTNVNLTGGTINGDVFGGGLGRQGDDPVEAKVYGDVTVTVDGTKIKTGYSTEENQQINAGRVFGANNLNGTPLGHVKVLVNKTAEVANQPIDLAAVFGGGNQAAYKPYESGEKAEVIVEKNNAADRLIIGNVYGGGNEAGVTGNHDDAGTQVTINSGEIKYGVYGGCNTSGTVSGNVSVTLTGGTIGSGTINDGVISYSDDKKANVHGGGFGKDTYVKGNVTVVIGELNTSTDLTIWGDVYGGSAEGHVNAIENTTANATEPTYITTSTTKVSLFAGTINGDAYGGGLGTLEKNGTPAHPAYVGGNVTIELNGNSSNTVNDNEKGAIVNRIFGANNVNGSPKGNIYVHVYGTQNREKNQIANTPADNENNIAEVNDAKREGYYDVKAVYGGGNEAAYIPTDPSSSATHVTIEGCDETSIETVYGGGNAAAVPETNVDIKGSYEIGTVFGGGNGKDAKSDGSPNPGADVGINNSSNYGSGNATTILRGGRIHEAYGGSNEKGNIVGTASINSNPTGAECTLVLDKMYGAGKNADIDGDLKIILGCLPDSKIEEIYGGAENANVKGDVELTITSGKFGKVFGGNKTSGAIFGHIILNIEETGDCNNIGIEIDELYGCGYDAEYSVYGFKQTGTDANGKPIYKARTSNSDGTAVNPPTEAYSSSQLYADPVVNIISCTRIGNVFGGGLGSNAIVYGSPKVNINMIPGQYASSVTRETSGTDSDEKKSHYLGNIGNVYGGGKEANVYGDATINIGTESTVTLTSLPKIQAKDDQDQPLWEDQEGTIPVMVLQTKNVEGAHITGNVFGGGLNAIVEGNTYVNIGANGVAYTTTNYEGVSISGNVYGGGEGESTNVTGTATVNLGANGETAETIVGTRTISQDIYGGSAYGTVNTAVVNLYNGTVRKVFGGGMGRNAKAAQNSEPAVTAITAHINTSTTVTLNGATVTTALYGGSDINGHIGSDQSNGTANVYLLSGSVGNSTYDSENNNWSNVNSVFGGGL